MELVIDLREYCSNTILQKGRSLYESRGITSPRCAQTAEGFWMLKGKSIDSFNFVNHPWVRSDVTGKKLLDYGCDCLESRKQPGMCVHCVALCHGWTGNMPEEKPLPETPVLPEEPATDIPAYTIEAPPADVTPIEEDSGEKQEDIKKEIRSMNILLGVDAEGNEILWCPNDTERTFHTNMGIIGTMGTGKTQFAKSMLTQLYRNQDDNYDGYPLGILVFDYKGDYNETKQDFVDAAKARVLKPYKLPYNPLALNPGKSFKPLLPTHTANEFKDTISQIYNLGPKQQHMLLECIITAYRKQGIDPANPGTWGRQAPTIEQVYRILADEMQGRPVDKLMTAMDKLHQFCLFEDDPRRAISLEQLLDGVVVIDISGYDSDIQSTVVAITLNQFYARMHARGSSPTDGKYRQLRKFIMVDEADTFMGENLPSLARIMKEGREFGVGVILSTQSLEHFVGSDDNYSRYVLTWIVHNVGDLKQKDVEYLFRLQAKSPEGARNYALIKKLQKHESVVKLGNDEPVAIRNNAFYQLYRQLKG